MSTSFDADEQMAAQTEIIPAGNAEIINTEEGTEAVTETKAGKQVVGEMLQPFKVRNFNLVFGGQTISTIGDALYAVALPWFILNNGGSPQELGIVLAVYGIPRVGSTLAGGWLSDRLRPRRLMLISDAVRAVLVAILALLIFRGTPVLWQLCVIALPLGFFGGAFAPASAAILPDILTDEELQAGNALSYSSTQGANLAGSAIAGVVVAVLSAGTAMMTDALSFVVSAVSLALMRTKGVSESKLEASEAENSTVSVPEVQISFGSFMRSSRLFQIAFVVSFASNFCFGGLLEVALPSLVHGPMHAGASGYGLILAAFSMGALAGSIFAGTLGRLKHRGLIALLLILVMAGMLALIPYGGLIGAIICMILAGISNSISNVMIITLLQLRIPRHLMGRVMSLFMFASFGTYPISVALGGVLTAQFGSTILFPFSGLLLALPILAGIAQRELREL
jgi:MFS family permease